MNSKTLEQELAKKIAFMDNKSFANFITRCCIIYNKGHHDKVSDFSLYHLDRVTEISFVEGEGND